MRTAYDNEELCVKLIVFICKLRSRLCLVLATPMCHIFICLFHIAEPFDTVTILRNNCGGADYTK